jgi:hypothetical protein
MSARRTIFDVDLRLTNKGMSFHEKYLPAILRSYVAVADDDAPSPLSL